MHIGKFPLRNFPSIYTAIARSYAAELGIPDSTCTYANVYKCTCQHWSIYLAIMVSYHHGWVQHKFL